MSPAPAFVAVIGAGPAGLMAAEVLAGAGLSVRVFDRMPSVGRKFLMAGRGGLNLTHTQPRPGFDATYDHSRDRIAPWLDAFPPQALIDWAEGLGQPTFVGSSGRVFPRAMKASPLLRAWLARLDSQGVEIVTRARWTGFDDLALTFENDSSIRPDATVLALGGASWPRLGSDGRWVPVLQDLGTAIAPLRPANVGVDVDWSPTLRDRFAGQPLKGIALNHGHQRVRGEAMVTAYGLEGGAVYALSGSLRGAFDRDGSATLTVDMRPDLSVEALSTRLARPRGRDSLSNWLRKAAGLSPAAIAVLREIPGEIPTGPEKLASRIKAVRLKLTGMQGLDRAISSAGGVRFAGLDDRLMLTARPGTFVAGEMIDWEAPTGGYLLQASFASGVVAAQGVLDWLATRVKDRP